MPTCLGQACRPAQVHSLTASPSTRLPKPFTNTPGFTSALSLLGPTGRGCSVAGGGPRLPGPISPNVTCHTCRGQKRPMPQGGPHCGSTGASSSLSARARKPSRPGQSGHCVSPAPGLVPRELVCPHVKAMSSNVGTLVRFLMVPHFPGERLELTSPTTARRKGF